MKSRQLLIPALMAGLLAGCAQVPPDAGQTPHDPHEAFNRHMWAFNDALDRAVLKPVAEGYVAVTNEPVRDAVSNAVDNLLEPNNAVNNLLQGKGKAGVESTFRFLVNSTFGIAGLFDVASWIGMERRPEDFGQTLAVWGAGGGSYWVLPFLGPTTTRDVWRYPVQWGLTPTTYLYWDEDWWLGAAHTVVTAVDGRARLLEVEDQVRGATMDEYIAVREAYLSMRRNAVRDGEVSEEEELGGLTPLNFEE